MHTSNRWTRTPFRLFAFAALCAVSFGALGSCAKRETLSDAYGNFEATEILVSAEGTGKLLKLSVEEGQTLQAGAIVGVVDTAQISLRRKQLQAMREASATRVSGILSQLAVLNEQKRVASVERERFEKLFQSGAATEKQVSDIKGNISVLDRQIQSVETQNAGVLAELRSLDAQIAQAADQLKKCVIANPTTGTILATYAEEGEVTTAGKPLYRLANLDELQLRAYASGDQLPAIKLGDRAQVLIDDGKTGTRTLEGTIRWISPKAEFTPKIIQTKEERVNLVYAVKIAVKNDGALKIGMPGEVRFAGTGVQSAKQ